jgi:hypothetical protein
MVTAADSEPRGEAGRRHLGKRGLHRGRRHGALLSGLAMPQGSLPILSLNSGAAYRRGHLTRSADGAARWLAA